jgi:hypothetical protein
MSDWKTASIAALGLLGIAAFIVFETHLGFERQIGILFALLPGAFLAATLGRHLAGTKHIFSLAMWPSIFFLSYLWYFALSYTAIKLFRMASRVTSNPR